jgi:glycine cleavage system aminomethyltransferase T
VPEAGTAVTKDGAEVGTVTSPVTSPDFGVIALAVLDSRRGDRRREGRRGVARPRRSDRSRSTTRRRRSHGV